MYRRRTINPRGVRKIDVQKERREARAAARGQAKTYVKLYKELIDRNGFRQLDADEALAHCLQIAYWSGWERGFRDTQKRALDRLDEALEKGTLVKP